jgi:hypothetical protein
VALLEAGAAVGTHVVVGLEAAAGLLKEIREGEKEKRLLCRMETATRMVASKRKPE